LRTSLGIETEKRSSEILVFDFLSHETMHHAFNEGFLKLLRAAFPDDKISFFARAAHIKQLSPRVFQENRIDFKPCEPFQVPFGLSRHNPIAGRIAARRCFATMTREFRGRRLRLAVILGVDANLYAIARARWPALSSAPLHLVVHSHLGDAAIWRSRNPFIRAGDFVAQLRHPLPASIHLIVLELGVKEAIVELSTVLAPSIETIEHPTLESEWIDASPKRADEVLRIAFLGHARREKGFHLFADLARLCKRPGLEFQAIGVAAPEMRDLDLSGISRVPSPEALSREAYLAALRQVDMVCVPMVSRAYDFTASGTVSDAVAALRPLIGIRNRSLDALVKRYGAIGYLAQSSDELIEFIRNFNYRDFVASQPLWVENLAKCRSARRPEVLARDYAQRLDRQAV
jgi:hypothetical protein